MNKVILLGRLTRDPDVRWTQGPETDDDGFMNIPEGVEDEIPFR